MQARAPAASSAAAAKPTASGVSRSSEELTSRASATSANAGGQHDRVPARRRARRAGRRPLPGRRCEHDHRGRPHRFEHAAFDVGALRHLIGVDHVRRRVQRDAEGDQRPLPAGPPVRQGEADRDEREQQGVGERVGEVHADRRRRALARAEHGREHEVRAERRQRQADDDAVEPNRRARVAEVRAHQQGQAHVDRRVLRQVERIGDRRVRWTGDVIEPQRPHEIAARPGEQAGRDQQPGDAVLRASHGAREAEADRDELDRRVQVVVGERVEAGAAEVRQRVRGVEGERRRERKEAHEQQPRSRLGARIVRGSEDACKHPVNASPISRGSLRCGGADGRSLNSTPGRIHSRT